MCNRTARFQSLVKALVAFCTGFIALSLTHIAVAEPYQEPLFLAAKVKPITMLNMSRDHQLYFKLYDDFSDITDSRPLIGTTSNPNYGKNPDGIPDTTYVHGFDYYGYFDSYKCYTYSTSANQFNPVSYSSTKYCNAAPATGQWSGNFLNWAAMTRIDAVRKILYGGTRSTDTTAATVLERAYLPTDAHSFAKYYAGADLPLLTPFTSNIAATDVLTRGITICNTSDPGTAGYSQAATASTGARPLLRVARGNYSLWASSERFQCRWRSSMSDSGQGVNGNSAGVSLINAYSDSPVDGNKLGSGSATGEYVARVAVCVAGLTAMDASHDNEKCWEYSATSVKKPRGLLQVHGATQNFALMTGSYGKNKSGGVLRKAVGSITDEIVTATGIFQVPTSGFSIIKTLDLLRIYGYRYSDGLYHNNSHAVLSPSMSQVDGCKWENSSFVNGQCVNWGNPQAEIYLESLRYLSGKTTPNYDVDDANYVTGLKRVASWVDPISSATTGNYCAPINVLQFDASMTSYDADDLTDLPSTLGNVDTATNEIGAAEGIHNHDYFVGENGSDNNQLCTSKTVGTLANVKGACPEAPRLQGSYKIAGLAYKARSQGIGANREKVNTYGVSLAASVPNVVVPVPGSTTAKVTILPACRNVTPNPDANCAIVDFKVVSQGSDATKNYGRLYVNWEDTEQGGDYDQDMWGVIDYEVTSSQVKIKTDSIAQSTPNRMGFGYVVSGTTTDGFYVNSGINGFNEGGCTNCNVGDAAVESTYAVGASSGKLLEPPLYYAAKWGGYRNDALTATEIAALSAPTYFKAIDPRQLEQKLGELLGEFGRSGSSATVASNSTRLEDETSLYQALFDSDDWSGRIQAYHLTRTATVDTANKLWDTDDTLTSSAGRNIYTLGSAGAVNISSSGWSSSNIATLKAALQLATETNDTNAQKRFAWLLGNSQDGLRQRTHLLGDIINSDPAYAGANDQRYSSLPATYGAATYDAYVETKLARKKAIFVGANDGMLHAFDAGTSSTKGTELFAYIPRGVYSKLADLSSIDYQHKYTVDGPLYVGDVWIDSNSDGIKEWRTLVGGTLGAGGKGAYLLDVTDVLESGGAPKVIFDLSADDTSLPYRNDLGYSNAKMLIVPTANDTWSAILSNGGESTNGTAAFIAIDVQTPTSYKVITASTATGNGLSGAALLPNGNGVSTYAYAGDLKGNMWKFDLTSNSRSSWKIAYGTSGTPKPLINVLSSTGTVQPITATPTLGKNSLKMAGSGANQTPSIMVYFGTGQYSSSTDISNTNVQSIYAIADTNNAISLSTANRNTKLKAKVITAQSSGIRTVAPDKTPEDTGTPVVDWATYDGWYLDLKYGTAEGERVLAKPLLMFDRLILNTFIPSPNQCDYGGSGWLMELTGVGDKFVGLTVLVNNANHQLDDPILGDLIPILAGEKVIIVGSELGTDTKDSDGAAIEAFIGDAGAGTRGRMSWRQVK